MENTQARGYPYVEPGARVPGRRSQLSPKPGGYRCRWERAPRERPGRSGTGPASDEV